jgi:hypothetical protein
MKTFLITFKKREFSKSARFFRIKHLYVNV